MKKIIILFFIWAAFIHCYAQQKVNEAMSYLNKAIEYDKQRNYELAILNYTIAIDKSSQNSDIQHFAFVNRGVGKAFKGDYQGSINDFTIAINMKVDKAEWVFEPDLPTITKKLKANSYLFRGLSKISLYNSVEACSDFRLSADMGNTLAHKYITEYCNSTPESRPPESESDSSPQRCTAIAKSTGMQCKNYVYKQCAYAECYVHCK